MENRVKHSQHSSWSYEESDFYDVNDPLYSLLYDPFFDKEKEDSSEKSLFEDREDEERKDKKIKTVEEEMYELWG